MEGHYCNKEAEISEIYTIVKRLDNKLDGENGLFQKFARWEGAVKIAYVVGTIGGISGIVSIIKTFV